MNWTAWKARVIGLLGAAAVVASSPTTAWGQAQTCNGLVSVDYVTGPNFAVPGDILRVRLTLGTGSINGGTQLTIQRLRFDLDCNSNFALGLPCTDEGLFVEYEGDGTITNTCGKTFTTGHATSATPNEVVLTPNTPIVIPANQSVPPGFCNVEFDIKVLQSPSIDSTPNTIEEVEGYKNTDAACDNGVLASGGQQSSGIPLCQMCNDNNECTDDACNQTNNQCVFTPKQDSTPCTDNDGNLCTTAGCEQGQCVQAHQTLQCPPDGNPCTQDLACNPQTGMCDHPPVPDSSPCPDTDNNACTTPGCESGQCVQAHMTTQCPPDQNECTNDLACDPQTGLCPHPPKPDSTPCTDNDNNLCTTAGCESGQCVQTHQTTQCPPDTNPCTQDPACNPQTGQCSHPPVPDSTPCPDTDGDHCTLAGCEVGQCVQTHLNTCPPPIDHQQCYEVKPRAFTLRTVSAQDQFGTISLKLRFPHRFCAPANKNNEGIPDPTEHLLGYKTSAKFTKVLNQTVVDQFGTLQLDVVRPDLFMVPTAKNGVALNPPPGDHFTCYKVRRSHGAAKFTTRTVTVVDQFESLTETLLKPYRLCAPASKNGEDPGAPLHPDHMLCYKTKPSPAFGTLDVTTDNQFGPDNPTLIHRRELCVPAQKNPGASTTSSTTTSSSSTTTSSTLVGSPSAAFVR